MCFFCCIHELVKGKFTESFVSSPHLHELQLLLSPAILENPKINPFVEQRCLPGSREVQVAREWLILEQFQSPHESCFSLTPQPYRYWRGFVRCQHIATPTVSAQTCTHPDQICHFWTSLRIAPQLHNRGHCIHSAGAYSVPSQIFVSSKGSGMRKPSAHIRPCL